MMGCHCWLSAAMLFISCGNGNTTTETIERRSNWHAWHCPKMNPVFYLHLGKVSVFNMMTFQIMSTFLAAPPAATFIAFHPQDSFIIAFGMEDSTIQIYNFRVGQVTNKIKGHHKKITGLSFSQLKNVLVSSGADAQLCVWSIDDWEKKDSRYMIQHPNHSGALDGDTRVQFHNDCQHLLVVNESQLAIYDWKLECSSLWSPGTELRSGISSAVFSCDGLLVFAGSCDGTIKIFQGDLNKVFYNIEPTDRVQGPLSSVGSVYPMVIAAHPSEPNQIALGMSDGEVIVLGLNIPTWAISWGRTGYVFGFSCSRTKKSLS